MRLESIQIFGFKSFADKCVFEFPHNRIAIVGPNGCGKSNVVDAVKWVLGDQSTKSVRVQKMPEVIFNGTVKRSPLHVADVIVTFDNSKGLVPLESNSITIRRTVHRDGEAEYKINNKAARLRDIRNIFLDSGIGLFEYAILEQGKIDQLLSLRPEQRLQFFDEAAGISNLRNRTRDIDQNLNIANEQKEVLESRIKELQELKTVRELQAEELERYQRMDKEVQRLDAVLHHRKLASSKREYKNSEDTITRLQAQHDVHTKLLQTQHNDSEAKRTAIHDLEKEYAGLEKQLVYEKTKQESKKDTLVKLRQELRRNEHLLVQRKRSLEELTRLLQKQRFKQMEDETKLAELQKAGKKLEQRVKKLQLECSEIEHEETALLKKKEACKASLRHAQKSADALHEQHSQKLDQLIQKVSQYQNSQDLEKQRPLLEETKGKLEYWKQLTDKSDNERGYQLLESIYRSLQEIFDTASDTLLAFFEYTEIKSSFDASLDAARNEEVKAKGSIDQLNGKLTALSTQKSEAKETLSAAQYRVKQNQYAMDLLRPTIRDRNDVLESTQSQMSGIERECQDLFKQVQELQKTLGSSETASSAETSLENSAKAIRTQLIQHRERLNGYEEQSRILKTKCARIEQSIQGAKMAMIRLSERIGNLEQKAVELASAEDPLLQEDTQTLTDRQQLLKREIHLVGKLNFLALDEKNEIGDKLQDLESQYEDIQDSLRDLETLHKSIQERSVVQLQESIKKIDREFNTVFKTLFQGGEAHVVLCDETDIQKGVAILAKPPGKKPHDIMQLSGGERTLAAIALLFATYLVQPAPFCILDEVDAMLDERNIGRFLQMLYQYTERTQFIIVTHNVQTMAAMDALIGVTMEEQGVSKPVSVRIDEELYANT